MKVYLLMLFWVVMAFAVSAQDPIKRKIGFIPFTDPGFANEELRELAYKNIYDAALRVFVNTQRFDVLDRGSFNIVKIEKEFQKGEDLANSEIVNQGKIAAAQLLAVAKISTFTITESDDGKGYSAYISAEFKQIDVESGKAVNALQLTSEITDKQEIMGVGNNKRISSEEEAISKVVSKMERDLEKWIKQNFPLILKVIDLKSADMGIIVEGGRDVGLTTKFNMKAVKIQIYPNGKKLITTIGKLKFNEEGVGEDLTEFKFPSKKEFDKFVELWTADPSSIYITEDL